MALGLPLDKAIKGYHEGTCNAIEVSSAMEKAGIPECVIDLFKEQHRKLVPPPQPAKRELTKEDVLSWVEKANFLKTDYNRSGSGDRCCIRQAFSMPNDNPFRADYDDGGGPYRLETIYVEYRYEQDKVRVLLSLSMDMRKIYGYQDPEFEQKCLAVLFKKEPRLEDHVVEEHVRKVRRDRLKQIIYTEIENSQLSNDDVAIAVKELLGG